MEIISSHIRNSEIDVIEYHGELTGRAAIQLADFLYTSLDEGKRYMIINLKQVKKADGLGLMVLENFINRGMQIRLINTGLDVQSLLRMSGKEDVIKTYDCLEQDEAASLLEKEIIGNKDKADGSIKGRRFCRINTSFNLEFTYPSAHNGEIMLKAIIRNISEGGVCTGNIAAFNTMAAMPLGGFEMIGKELCGLTFSLNGESSLIETDGTCVWETGEYENRSAGIRFGDMSQNHKDMIRDYVYKQKLN